MNHRRPLRATGGILRVFLCETELTGYQYIMPQPTLSYICHRRTYVAYITQFIIDIMLEILNK
jgi:hypothetical protein